MNAFSDRVVARASREFQTLAAGGNKVVVNTAQGRLSLRMVSSAQEMSVAADGLGYPLLAQSLRAAGDRKGAAAHYLIAEKDRGLIGIIEISDRNGLFEATAALPAKGIDTLQQGLAAASKVLADKMNDLRLAPAPGPGV